ncbi:MAG: peptidoglycan-binding protein LysM [Burkholderiales bacterium]|nr:peptidoglycan-binding protein LysM [Burkholderiales bacterium]ODU62908.1 MAG: peptidoglycan-binding protein LysM [Lautropia sp. SCN 66-9]
MGLLSFIKDAGEKLFGSGQAQAAQKAAEGNPSPENIAAASAAAGKAIEDYIRSMNLQADGLKVAFDASTRTVKVSGEAADQATREKIVLCCGNVASVEKVEDNMTVKNALPAAQYYTVVRGDTLSKIAKDFYGNANAYMQIFEANKPMLSHPDKIYPGQTLRIPPKA